MNSSGIGFASGGSGGGSGSGITALTGDVTATGPGSVPATLATVNPNVGSFAIPTITVNGKGLITAAAAASVTGSGAVVLATSPTIVTPTIASFVNANHNHQNAAGGGTLVLAAISDAGTMAAQNDDNVAISGGSIDGADIGLSNQGIGQFSRVLAFSYYDLENVVAPVTPAVGILRLFADMSNRPAWKDSDGFITTLDSTGINANRTYTLQNASGTLAFTSDIPAAGITALTGDATATGPGSAALTLATVNGNVGSFAIATVTVNAKGLVTAASAASTTGSGAVVLTTSPTIVTPTIASFTNATHTHLNAAGGGALDTAAIASGTLAAARMPALTGDITTSAGAVATTLATVNSNVGSFAIATVTVNGKGLVTAASAASTTGSGSVVLATSPTIVTPTIAKLANLTTNGFVKTGGGDGTLSVDTATYLTANQTITLSGDVTGSGATAITTTLATVNSNVGSFAIATVTVNGKGLVTAASAASTTGSGSVVLATSPTITTPTIASITGPTTVTVSNSATTTVTTILTIDTTSSGTPATGYGLALFFTGKTSTTAARNMAQVRTTWTTATEASQVSNLILSVYNIATAVDALTLTTAGGTLLASDAATNTTTNVLTLDHNSSGTPAASFGTALLLNGKDDTTVSQNMGQIRAIWTTATHASHVANVVLSVYDTASHDLITLSPYNITFPAVTSSNGEGFRFLSGANNLVNFQAQDISGTTSYVFFTTNRFWTGSAWSATGFISTRAAATFQLENEVMTYWTFAGSSNTPTQKARWSTTGLKLGSSTTTFTDSLARLHVIETDANTVTATTVAYFDHSSSGIPGVNFGTNVLIAGASSTTASQNMGIFEAFWTTATHASRKAQMNISVYDTAKRTAIYIGASGTAPLLSFFSVTTPVIQPASANQAAVVTTGAALASYGYTQAQADSIVTLVNQLRADLVSLGLIKGSA